MRIRTSKESAARHADEMRDAIGAKKKEIKLALPPTYPFNDDEYEEMIMEKNHDPV